MEHLDLTLCREYGRLAGFVLGDQFHKAMEALVDGNLKYGFVLSVF